MILSGTVLLFLLILRFCGNRFVLEDMNLLDSLWMSCITFSRNES